jgi:hypothetical protein
MHPLWKMSMYQQAKFILLICSSFATKENHDRSAEMQVPGHTHAPGSKEEARQQAWLVQQQA